VDIFVFDRQRLVQIPPDMDCRALHQLVHIESPIIGVEALVLARIEVDKNHHQLMRLVETVAQRWL
jgi:hypothetical protein